MVGQRRAVSSFHPYGGNPGPQRIAVNFFIEQIVPAYKSESGSRDNSDAEARSGPGQCRPGIVVHTEDVRLEAVLQAGVRNQLLEAAVNDKRPVLQFAELDGRTALCERKLTGHDGDHRLGFGIPAFQAGSVEGGADYPDFHDAPVQEVEDFEGVPLMNVEFHAFVRTMELAEPVLKKRRAGR
ncbi:hypothetical protein D3C76_1307570 [compost metagenome]